MEVDTRLIIEGLLTLGSLAASFGAAKVMVERDRQEIDMLWKWKNIHEKEAAEVRIKNTEQFGEIHGLIKQKVARDEDIIRRLERIESKIDKGNL